MSLCFLGEGEASVQMSWSETLDCLLLIAHLWQHRVVPITQGIRLSTFPDLVISLCNANTSNDNVIIYTVKCVKVVAAG